MSASSVLSVRRPRYIALVAVPLASLLLASACGAGSFGSGGEGGADGPVKIGLSVPLSGVYASPGEDMTQGFDLYLKQHDGQLGGHDIDVVRADEGETPQIGVPATTKLVTQNGVSAVVGIMNSATALGVKDTFVQSKVPLIVTNAGADDLIDDSSPYIWRTSFTNGQVGAALGPVVADQMGDKKVFLMAPDVSAGHESVEGFRKTFTKAGGVVAGEAFTPFGTTTDWQPFLSRVRSSGAGAVYVMYGGAEAVNFVKQFNSFGLSKDIQLYGAGFVTEGGVLAAQGDAAMGVRTALHYSHTLKSERNVAFVKAYQAAYDKVPTSYAVQAYDAAAVLDSALERADATDGASVAKALTQVGEIDSPRGTWTFDEQHSPDQPFYLREVQQTPDGLANVIVEELKK